MLACVLIGFAVGVDRRGTAIAGSGAAQTFSEIECARQTIEAAKHTFLSDWCFRYFQLKRRETTSPDTGPDQTIRMLIRELQAGLADFEGPEHDFGLRQFLFSALDQNGLHDAWVKVYLKLLYEDPGNDTVRVLRDRALELSRATGRESEVKAGFRHWDAIPDGFAKKPMTQPADEVIPKAGESKKRLRQRRSPRNCFQVDPNEGELIP